MTENISALADEQLDYSHKKALELIGKLFTDGDNGRTIQSVFMVASAMSASMNEMNKEKYLDGCSKVYDLYEKFSDHIDGVISRYNP